MSAVHHFPGRDLHEYAEYVPASQLQVGTVYFRVLFLDDEIMVPELEALVFIGTGLDREIPSERADLFFQDFASYQRGDRWADDYPPVGGNTEEERLQELFTRPRFETYEAGCNSAVLTFDNALNVLLRCSLWRKTRGSDSAI